MLQFNLETRPAFDHERSRDFQSGIAPPSCHQLSCEVKHSLFLRLSDDERRGNWVSPFLSGVQLTRIAIKSTCKCRHARGSAGRDIRVVAHSRHAGRDVKVAQEVSTATGEGGVYLVRIKFADRVEFVRDCVVAAGATSVRRPCAVEPARRNIIYFVVSQPRGVYNFGICCAAERRARKFPSRSGLRLLR